MRVVVYESMFGNTRRIAEAIGEGMGGDTVVVPVHDATPELVARADLLVVGGPTHAHGMTRAKTREMAGEMARKPDSGVALEPDACGAGLREWFDRIGSSTVPAAAFDTRMHGPATFTGRASKGVQRLLRRCGAQVVAAPESFLVTKDNHLDDGELDRARAWGEQLAGTVGRIPVEVGSE